MLHGKLHSHEGFFCHRWLFRKYKDAKAQIRVHYSLQWAPPPSASLPPLLQKQGWSHPWCSCCGVKCQGTEHKVVSGGQSTMISSGILTVSYQGKETELLSGVVVARLSFNQRERWVMGLCKLFTENRDVPQTILKSKQETIYTKWHNILPGVQWDHCGIFKVSSKVERQTSSLL